MASIHASALVDPKADLADSVTVGPYAVIGPDVRIGEGTTVGAHCVIEGRTTIGADNRIFQFASLGAAPQDKKYAGEPTELRVGDRNTIREFVTFNVGTTQGGGVTQVGNDNWVMAYVHVAHDCHVGNNTIFANCTQLAGHVEIGDWVILGGSSLIHQWVKIGAHAMTAMGTALPQDLPPFVMASGNMAEAHGFNIEGLKRRGFSAGRITAVKRMHRLIYRAGLTLDQAREGIAAIAVDIPEASGDVEMMASFLARSTRGIVR
ncbi:acyl-ACP--UDP-N-acetylglucosamine O-acyltransferase [soil metagenome]